MVAALVSDSEAVDGAARVAPGPAELPPDGDGVFHGAASATPLVRLAHRAAAPRARRVMVRHGCSQWTPQPQDRVDD
jgi:hypothetical protein